MRCCSSEQHFFIFAFMKRYIFLTFICISVFEFTVAQCDTIKAAFTSCAEGKGGLYPDKYQDNTSIRKYYYYTFTYDNVLYAVPIEEHGTIFRDWCIVVENSVCIDTISAEEMNIVLSLNSNPTSRKENSYVPKPSSSLISYSISSVEFPKYVSLKQKFDYEKLNNLIDYFKTELTTNPRLSTFVCTEPYFYYSKRCTKTRSAEDGIISFDEAFKQIQKDADFRAYYDTVMYQYDIDFLTMLLDDYNARYGVTEIEVEQTDITEIKQTLSISVKDNTIICNVPFQIITIKGQNVTEQNGSLLSGTYIVVTEQGSQKVAVK